MSRIHLPSASQLRAIAARQFGRWAKAEAGRIQSAFGTGGHATHGGKQWLPRKHIYPWPILLKTGALKRSVYGTRQGNGAVLGATAHYAPYHQWGTPTLPVRLVVDITQPDLETLERDLKLVLESAIRSGGGA